MATPRATSPASDPGVGIRGASAQSTGPSPVFPWRRGSRARHLRQEARSVRAGCPPIQVRVPVLERAPIVLRESSESRATETPRSRLKSGSEFSSCIAIDIECSNASSSSVRGVAGGVERAASARVRGLACRTARGRRCRLAIRSTSRCDCARDCRASDETPLARRSNARSAPEERVRTSGSRSIPCSRTTST